MKTQQFEFAGIDGRDVCDKGGLNGFVQWVIQKCGGEMRRIGIVGFLESAIESGIADHEAGGGVIGMTVFPEGSDNNLRAVLADGTRDENAIGRRIGETAIGESEIFARLGAHKFSSLHSFVIAFFDSSARTEFAASEIDDGEGDGPLMQKQSDAADAPFDVVGMSSKE